MAKVKKDRRKSYKKQVQAERERLLARMAFYEDPTAKEYQSALMALMKLEEIEQKRHARSISGDTALKCGASVGTAVGMMVFEERHSLPSKLLSFIPKLKL